MAYKEGNHAAYYNDKHLKIPRILTERKKNGYKQHKTECAEKIDIISSLPLLNNIVGSTSNSCSPPKSPSIIYETPQYSITKSQSPTSTCLSIVSLKAPEYIRTTHGDQHTQQIISCDTNRNNMNNTNESKSNLIQPPQDDEDVNELHDTQIAVGAANYAKIINNKRKKKRKKKHKNNASNINQYQYISTSSARAQFAMPKRFLENVVQNTSQGECLVDYDASDTKDQFADLNSFLRRNMTIRRPLIIADKMIIDLGLVSKQSQQPMYVVVRRDNVQKRNYKWKLLFINGNYLFTAEEMSQQYNVTSNDLQALSVGMEEYFIQHRLKIVAKYFKNKEDIIKIISNTKWHNSVPIFNNEKIQNKNALVLKIEKSIFTENINQFIKFQSNDNTVPVSLIPIVMLKDGKPSLQFVWILPIDMERNIHVGISFTCNKDKLVVTGIHVNKQLIKQHHQLIHPYHKHECNCLNEVDMSVDDLRIICFSDNWYKNKFHTAFTTFVNKVSKDNKQWVKEGSQLLLMANQICSMYSTVDQPLKPKPKPVENHIDFISKEIINDCDEKENSVESNGANTESNDIDRHVAANNDKTGRDIMQELDHILTQPISQLAFTDSHFRSFEQYLLGNEKDNKLDIMYYLGGGDNDSNSSGKCSNDGNTKQQTNNNESQDQLNENINTTRDSAGGGGKRDKNNDDEKKDNDDKKPNNDQDEDKDEEDEEEEEEEKEDKKQEQKTTANKTVLSPDADEYMPQKKWCSVPCSTLPPIAEHPEVATKSVPNVSAFSSNQFCNNCKVLQITTKQIVDQKDLYAMRLLGELKQKQNEIQQLQMLLYQKTCSNINTNDIGIKQIQFNSETSTETVYSSCESSTFSYDVTKLSSEDIDSFTTSKSSDTDVSIMDRNIIDMRDSLTEVRSSLESWKSSLQTTNIQRKCCSVQQQTKSAVIYTQSSMQNVSLQESDYKHIDTEDHLSAASLPIIYSKKLIKKVIPTTIIEQIVDPKDYMNKHLKIYGNNALIATSDGQHVIIDFKFHSKSKEPLYAVADKTKGNKWKLKHELYYGSNVETKFNVSIKSLKTQLICKEKIGDTLNEIQNMLKNKKKRNRITGCKYVKWETIVIHAKQSNTPLSQTMTDAEFSRRLQKFSNNSNDMNLVPIVTFKEDKSEYCIAILWIVDIGDCNIGIALHVENNKLIVSGIYLDIYDNHLLVPYKHECNCLEDFHCKIDDLKILTGLQLELEINKSDVIRENKLLKSKLKETNKSIGQLKRLRTKCLNKINNVLDQQKNVEYRKVSS